MFRNALEPWHLIILVLVIVLVFGANRLPDAARSLGRSMRIFKSEVNEMQKDDKATTTTRTTAGGDEVVTEHTTTTRTEQVVAEAPRAAGATAPDEYVVIDGVRYRREPGDGTPRA